MERAEETGGSEIPVVRGQGRAAPSPPAAPVCTALRLGLWAEASHQVSPGARRDDTLGCDAVGRCPGSAPLWSPTGPSRAQTPGVTVVQAWWPHGQSMKVGPAVPAQGAVAFVQSL